jgi:hypothetical protein
MINTELNTNLGYPKENPFAPKKKPLTISSNDDVSLMIETVSGRRINPTNPDALQIDIQDIAWSLSRIPRYVGHTITATPYNVAQHSVYVAQLVEKMITREIVTPIPEDDLDAAYAEGSLGLHALFHDAHEAYTGDIPSPIKRIPELRGPLKAIEQRLDSSIREAFGLEDPSESIRNIVKYADNLAQAVESYQFMSSRGLSWNLPKASLALLHDFQGPKSPLESYQIFLEEYSSLNG